MEYLPLLLQQDANKMYPNILNCAPTNPPQWPWRVSHTFFLNRRKGIRAHTDFWWDEVLDYIQYEWNEYWLVRDWWTLLLRKNGISTTLATQTYDSKKYHSFKYVSAVGWNMNESWSWANWSSSTGTFYLEDATKSWTVNEYAWQRVYCYAWDAWVWQVFKITANDWTKLTLESWYDTTPTNVDYKIFDAWTEVPAFVWWDWVYVIHNDSNVIKVEWFWEVIDAEYNAGRLFALDMNYNVLTSATSTNDWAAAMWWGYYWFYVNASSILWTALNAFRMVTFKDSVLLLSTAYIKMVKTMTVDISWTTITSYIVTTITNFVWAHSASAIRIFNQWLYMLSSNNKLVAVSITEVATNRFEVKLDDMWQNIQQWIDNIASDDTISIDMTDNEVILIRYDRSKAQSYIFKFDQYYQFRYRWETNLSIYKVRVFLTPYYLWDKVYSYNEDFTADEWDQTYIQNIKLFVGEEDIFALKEYITHKLYIGKNTKMTTTVNYKAFIDWQNYEVNIPLSQVQYLIDATSYTSLPGMWWTILWMWLLWSMYDAWYVSDLLLANINVLELPIAFTVSLMEITIQWDFEIGWMMLWYEKIEPHITPINSVVWYTK